MHVIATHLQQSERAIVVWLAHSEELCDQAFEECGVAWASLGNREITIYRAWGSAEHLNIDDIRDGVVIAGLARLFERAKRDSDFISRLADRTSLVVMDEAHQSVAPTYQFLLDYFCGRRSTTALLGLTATPGRTWNEPDDDKKVAEIFARQKVMLAVDGHHSPVDYLVAEGYLARTSFTSLPFTAAMPLGTAVLQELSRSLEIPVTILEKLAEDDRRNLLLVSATEDLLRRHARVIVFAATVGHAHLLATVLGARGVEAYVIAADTPPTERARTIARFRGDQQNPIVLCNFGVLTAGFDAPRTSAVVIARPTKSLVLYSQMVGRAIRGPRAGGNEHAEVLTVVDTTLPGFSRVADAFANWEDVWE
jgi:superfamily II DNA or RNA helicase